MTSLLVEHPDPESLAAFALGKLSLTKTAALADHLECCPHCEAALQDIPDDPFLSLVRSLSFLPGLKPRSDEEAADGELRLPAELAQHPRYRILRSLGRGGMGDVYLASHQVMNRMVALKVIRKDLTMRPAAVQRFQREVQAAARLSHPRIVVAYDAEQTQGLHFLVMEYVEGMDLARLVAERGPLPIQQACVLVLQTAEGLQHAFEQGLVHRDIKPQNLMLTSSGQLKILDFGLSILRTEEGGKGTVTEEGQGLGTPDFASPEQIRDAHRTDIRGDIYSLGCTFYFLLTAQLPFPEGGILQKVASQLEREPPPLASLRADIPSEVARIVERMMAKDPSERFQTPSEVVKAFQDRDEGIVPGKAATQRLSRWLLASVAVGTLVVGLSIAACHENGSLETSQTSADEISPPARGEPEWPLPLPSNDPAENSALPEKTSAEVVEADVVDKSAATKDRKIDSRKISARDAGKFLDGN